MVIKCLLNAQDYPHMGLGYDRCSLTSTSVEAISKTLTHGFKVIRKQSYLVPRLTLVSLFIKKLKDKKCIQSHKATDLTLCQD